MLLTKDASPIVFEFTNDTFQAIAEIDDFKSLQWSESYRGHSSFEMWAPVNERNKECFKKGNIIWLGGDTAAVIEIVNPQTENENVKVYDIKGRTIECFLHRRIIWGTFYAAENDDIAYSMQRMVDFNFVNLTPEQIASGLGYRAFNWMEVDDTFRCGITNSFQRTGVEVYDALVDIAQNYGLGFKIKFEPEQQKLLFQVYKGVDRTINNTAGNEPVVFDTDMEDVLGSNYYTSDQDYKNVGFVAGEGSGYSRSWVVVGDEELEGVDRREIYVDARDVQSEQQDAEGNIKVLTEEEYTQSLTQRGEETLAEHVVVESFESKIRVVGDVNYQYGVDYFIGDMITVIDRDLGLQVNAQVMSAEEVWADTYSLNLTFGFTRPTILQKVRRMIR